MTGQLAWRSGTAQMRCHHGEFRGVGAGVDLDVPIELRIPPRDARKGIRRIGDVQLQLDGVGERVDHRGAAGRLRRGVARAKP